MKKSSLHIYGISITALMLIVLAWCTSFGWHIPYINWAPWDLASYLVQHQRPASECFDLVWFEIMSPTQSEQRALCVHEYAKLAKDPTACELLMPSSYGLSCVGGASRSPICGVNPGFEVQWHEGDEIKRSSLKDCQKKGIRSARGNECCIVATVSAIRTFNDCSSLANDTPVYDDCLQELSFKNHDPTTCEGITDAKLKVACIVRAKAMKQDPSICTGCTPLLEKLEDIK